MIHANEAGMNLSRPADRRRLERMVTVAKPDLLIAGPLYKLARRSGAASDWDSEAMDLINFFDDLRTRHDCALMLEHHLVKKGQGTTHFRDPDQGGSAMFRRWPEMSFSMVRDELADDDNVIRLHRYRRARNEEMWPTHIQRRGPGQSRTGFAWLPRTNDWHARVELAEAKRRIEELEAELREERDRG